MPAARPGRACSFMAATIKSFACSRTSSIERSGIELLHAAESGLDSSAPAGQDGLALEEPGGGPDGERGERPYARGSGEGERRAEDERAADLAEGGGDDRHDDHPREL